MHITVIGATGYIGQALIRQLLHDTDSTITGFSKSADKLAFQSARFTALAGDVFNESQLATALHNCDVAIYLVHMMGASHADYAHLEAAAARLFGRVARQEGVGRVIFLGGLGDDRQQLSKHLSSRQRTGTILRKECPLVIEFRASMIIGDGSVGYEIIKAIALKLPVTAVPRWANTATQPIGLQDALRYLIAGLTVPIEQHQIIEIGGPEVLRYPQILERYTAWKGRHHHVFMVPGVPRWAAKVWLNQFVSNKASGIGGPMVESLHHPMVVTNDTAHRLFPTIVVQPIEQAFKQA